MLLSIQPVSKLNETELKLFIILGQVDPNLALWFLAICHTCEGHHSIS